jgi:hypothetical protein
MPLFNNVKIDLTNSYCPLGCCQPLYLIFLGLVESLYLGAVDIVGMGCDDIDLEVALAKRLVENNESFMSDEKSGEESFKDHLIARRRYSPEMLCIFRDGVDGSTRLSKQKVEISIAQV